MSVAAPVPPSGQMKLSDVKIPDDAPPEYKEAMGQVIDDVKKKMAEDPAALQKKFVEVFNSDDVDKAFRDRILGLVDTMNKLTKDFDTVSKAVLAFDLKKYHDKDYKPIPAFRPEWDTIHTDYISLMWRSRRFATTIKKRVVDYKKIILPMLLKDGVSDAEKLKNVNYFLGISEAGANAKTMEEKLKKDETEAEEISRAFTVLKGRVADYSTRLKQALADAKEGMKKEIADLDAKILKIQAKLDGLGVTRTGMLAGMGGAAFGALVGVWGAMAATGILAPIAAVGAVISALAFLGLGIASAVTHFKLIADAQNEMNTAQNDRRIALDRQKDLDGTMSAQIDQALTASNDICTQLSNLASIFASIRTDAQGAREHLQSALDSDAPAIFREESINLTTAAYEKLELALTMYADGFDKSPMPQPGS